MFELFLWNLQRISHHNVVDLFFTRRSSFCPFVEIKPFIHIYLLVKTLNTSWVTNILPNCVFASFTVFYFHNLIHWGFQIFGHYFEFLAITESRLFIQLYFLCLIPIFITYEMDEHIGSSHCHVDINRNTKNQVSHFIQILFSFYTFSIYISQSILFVCQSHLLSYQLSQQLLILRFFWSIQFRHHYLQLHSSLLSINSVFTRIFEFDSKCLIFLLDCFETTQQIVLSHVSRHL